MTTRVRCVHKCIHTYLHTIGYSNIIGACIQQLCVSLSLSNCVHCTCRPRRTLQYIIWNKLYIYVVCIIVLVLSLFWVQNTYSCLQVLHHCQRFEYIIIHNYNNVPSLSSPKQSWHTCIKFIRIFVVWPVWCMHDPWPVRHFVYRHARVEAQLSTCQTISPEL